MSKPYYKTLEDVPQLVKDEYMGNNYSFRVPPVPHNRWTIVDWINYVTFYRLEVVDGEYKLREV